MIDSIKNNSAFFSKTHNTYFFTNKKYEAIKTAPFQYDEFIKCKNISFGSNSITHDSFTGMEDKTSLLSNFELKRLEALNNNKNLGIAMFDMDNFKSINELLGYETGDVFIKATSDSIKSVTDEQNLSSYRFGGEEFIIIFSDQTEDEMQNICAKIQEKLDYNPVMNEYSSKYVASAEEKLEDLKDEMIYFQAFKENKTKLKTLLDLKDKSEDLAKNKVFCQEIENCYKAIIMYLECMLKIADLQEHDNDTKKVLEVYLEKLETDNESEKQDIIFSKALGNYLSMRFDKTVEMYRIQSWLNDYKRNGFNATCEILELQPEKCKDEKPLDVINQVGELLKISKEKSKGELYIEKID